MDLSYNIMPPGYRALTFDNPLKDYPKFNPRYDDADNDDDVSMSDVAKIQRDMEDYHLKRFKEPLPEPYTDFTLCPRTDAGTPILDWNADTLEAYSKQIHESNIIGFHVTALPPKYARSLNGVIHPFNINLDLDLVLSACNNAVEAFNQRPRCKDSVGELKFLSVEDCMIQLFTKRSHVFYLTFGAILVPSGDVRTCQAKVVLKTMHVLAFRFKPSPVDTDKSESHWTWKENYIGVRVVPEDTINKLTGFDHNAVTCFGMKTDSPDLGRRFADSCFHKYTIPFDPNYPEWFKSLFSKRDPWDRTPFRVGYQSLQESWAYIAANILSLTLYLHLREHAKDDIKFIPLSPQELIDGVRPLIDGVRPRTKTCVHLLEAFCFVQDHGLRTLEEYPLKQAQSKYKRKSAAEYMRADITSKFRVKSLDSSPLSYVHYHLKKHPLTCYMLVGKELENMRGGIYAGSEYYHKNDDGSYKCNPVVIWDEGIDNETGIPYFVIQNPCRYMKDKGIGFLCGYCIDV